MHEGEFRNIVSISKSQPLFGVTVDNRKQNGHSEKNHPQSQIMGLHFSGFIAVDTVPPFQLEMNREEYSSDKK